VEAIVPKILAYRPEVMARATISPKSVSYLAQSVQYLARLGFKAMTFKIAANCDWKEEDFITLREQYEKVSQFYIEQWVAGKPINIDDFRKGLKSMHSVTSNARFPCGAGRGVVLVDPRGDLWPCHRFGPHQCGGQFRLGKLGGPFNDRLRDVFLEYNMLEDTKAGCQNCRAALNCRSWCYAECVDSTHTFYDPGPAYCQANRVLHDIILNIHDRLRTRHADILKQIVNTP
jgi:uncharacterized protein